MSVCAMCAYREEPWRPEEGNRFSETGVAGPYGPSCGVLEHTPDPLQKASNTPNH